MTQAVDKETGQLFDATGFLGALRDLDLRIAQVDKSIAELKDDLKAAKKHRDGLVAELRATARGDRPLPFGDQVPPSIWTPSSQDPASDTQKDTA